MQSAIRQNPQLLQSHEYSGRKHLLLFLAKGLAIGLDPGRLGKKEEDVFF